MLLHRADGFKKHARARCNYFHVLHLVEINDLGPGPACAHVGACSAQFGLQKCGRSWKAAGMRPFGFGRGKGGGGGGGGEGVTSTALPVDCAVAIAHADDGRGGSSAGSKGWDIVVEGEGRGSRDADNTGHGDACDRGTIVAQLAD
jgi:hypothetical protein